MARVQYFGKTTASTSVTVYWAGTTTKPTIYGSATGSSISNPLTSTFEGDYSFWVDEGHYKILNGKLVNGVATNIDDAYILSTQGAEPTASKSSLAPFQTNTATDVEEWVEGAYTGATYVAASALKSATTVVGVAAATAPVNGQVLTATSSTTATWQTPASGTPPGADTNIIYNDAGAYGADANLTWNKTTKVHTLTGGYYSNTQAVAATSTDGVVLATSATATSGNQKFSPRARWHGSGWKTDATASAQDVDMIAELQPVQGAANPTMQLVFKWSVNGAAYNATPPLTIIGGNGGADDGVKIGTAYLRDEGSGQLSVNRINYIHAAGISTTGYFGAGSFGIGDTFFSRVAAANWNLGRELAANPPVAQTLSVQDASGTDIAGATWTFRASRGTGAGAVTGKAFSWQTPDVGATGTTLQTATEKWYMNSTGELVNTLPVAATSTDGLVLATSATATSGNQKYSPRVRLRGSYFSGSAKSTDWAIDNQPTASGGLLALSHSDNGAAYSTKFYFTQAGQFAMAGGGTSAAPDIYYTGSGAGNDTGIYFSGTGASSRVNISAAQTSTLSVGFNICTTGANGYFGWSSNGFDASATADTFIYRPAAANVRFGAAAANPPVAQTLSVQDASGTDIAGATWTFRGSRGTGTGTPGSIAFQTSTALGTGTTLQTATTRLTISSTKITAALPINLPSYTVAGLPTGADGDLAYASNGRKVGEGAGAGTGSMVCYSNGSWRRLSDETAITA